MQALSYSPSTTLDPVIAVRRRNHYFGQGQLRKRVLFDINLAIHPGEIVLMTGPSCSGRTTLLTLICGLRSTQEGSLRLLNQELLGAKQDQLIQVRRQIGYIFGVAHSWDEFKINKP